MISVLLASALLAVGAGAAPSAPTPPCSNGDDLSWLFEGPSPEPPETPPDLTWLLAPVPQPAATTDAAAAGAIALASTARKPGDGQIQATCTEDCNELPDISCTGNVCNAVSRDCSEFACERGSVTCDGNTTLCSQVCPPNCTFFECRQGCKQPGCVAVCLDRCTCECDTICQ